MDCDKITKPARLSVKALRKQTNRLKRKVEKEVRRQELIVSLHKEQMKLNERMVDLSTNEDNRLYRQAEEEYRIERNERRY